MGTWLGASDLSDLCSTMQRVGSGDNDSQAEGEDDLAGVGICPPDYWLNCAILD